MTGAGSHCICALLSRPLPRYLPDYSILCAAVYRRAEAALEYWAKPINVFVWWLQSELGTYLVPNRCLCAPSVCLIGGIQGLTLILSQSVSCPLVPSTCTGIITKTCQPTTTCIHHCGSCYINIVNVIRLLLKRASLVKGMSPRFTFITSQVSETKSRSALE